MGRNPYEASALHNDSFPLDLDDFQPSNVGFGDHTNLNSSWSSAEKLTDSDGSFDLTSDCEKNASHSTPFKKKTRFIKDSEVKVGATLQDESSCVGSKQGPENLKMREKLNKGRKGQYVSKFPAFKSCHVLKAKSRVKTEIQIRSGCKLGPKMIEGHKFQIRESSVFDALAEIFHFMCKNYKGFDIFCETSRCKDLQSCFFGCYSCFL